MRHIPYVIGLLLALLCVQEANATNCGTGSGTCYQLTGNWNTSGTWSDSDGGASCACTPATGDSVYITASSGNGTINANISLTQLDANGFTGTLTHNASTTVTITGNSGTAPSGHAFRLASGMTYTTSSTSGVTFAATSGTTNITSAGKTLRTVIVNGAGGTAQLQDATIISTTLTLTAGTLDTNSQTLSLTAFLGSGTSTRAITCGSTNIVLTQPNGTPWSSATTTNMTVTGCEITFTATTTGDITLSFGAITFDSVTLNLTQWSNLLAGFFISSGGGTIGTLVTNGFRNIGVAGTVTITNALTLGGTNASDAVLWRSASTSGIRPTITFGASSTANWAAFSNIGVSGTLTTTNSMDLGNNTGFTINPPAGGATGSIRPGLQ